MLHPRTTAQDVPPPALGGWSPECWRRFLSAELGHPVRVRYGRSRTVPVHAKGETVAGEPGLTVRMHRMFAAAPSEVRADLARWLRVGRRARRACARLDDWIEETLAREPRPAVARRLDPGGRCYDLRRLAQPLLETFFERDFRDRARPGLTWGLRRKSACRRSLRLGSYDLDAHVVRIHPVLDQPAVPDWFVRAVLMHEILHAAHPPHRGDGKRWVHHGADFRRREASYPDQARALGWEERNLDRLIRSARNGTRFVAAREITVKQALFDWLEG